MGTGTLILVIGLVAIIGGVMLLGYAEMQQEENNDGFFTGGEEESEAVSVLRTVGYVAGGAGILAFVTGIVLMTARRSTA